MASRPFFSISRIPLQDTLRVTNLCSSSLQNLFLLRSEDSEVNLDGDIILKGDFRFSSADVHEELSGDVAIDAKATLVTPEGKFDSAEVILGETPVVLSLMTFPITLNLLTNFAGLEPYDLECEFQVESRYPIGVEYSSIVRLYNDDLDAIGEFPIGSKISIQVPCHSDM